VAAAAKAAREAAEMGVQAAAAAKPPKKQAGGGGGEVPAPPVPAPAEKVAKPASPAAAKGMHGGKEEGKYGGGQKEDKHSHKK
jgi:hypothetical protein